MDISVIDKTITELSSKFKTIHVVLNGGEPLLQPINFFEQVVSIEKSIKLKTGVKFFNYLQTNGTLYSKQLAGLLKDENISVGISIDGPRNIHNINRKYNNQAETYDTILSNLNSLYQTGIKLSALVVNSKPVVDNPIEIYNFFKQKQVNFQLNDMLNLTVIDKSLVPSKEDLAKFYCSIFDLWIEDGVKPFIKVEPLYSFLLKMFGKDKVVCTYKRDCLNYIAIEPNGDFSICGRLISSKETYLGNIYKENVFNIMNKLEDFENSKRLIEKPLECSTCKWINICSGGCQASAFFDGEGIGHKTYWCETRKIVFNYIYKKLKDI
jgi:uncharacterized protein